MAKKIFDIMPPYPEEKRTYRRESPKKKQEKKSKSLFFSFILVSFFAFLFYAFLKTDSQIRVTQNSKSTSSNDQFELFNNQGDSSFTQNTNPIVVRILNGSSGTNNAIAARDILLKNGFQIEKLEKATTETEKTIIYYKKGGITSAQKVSDSIKSALTTTTQESQNLDKSYDILIIIGAK